MTLPEPATSPVNDLADRFWEAVLELNPSTAKMYGDERYGDRLEDPLPIPPPQTGEPQPWAA